MRSMFTSILAVLGLALSAPLAAQPAESMVESGDIIVHYNALGTTQLTAEVARQYAITRSANRGLLNVSVQRREGEATPAIPASIEAAATNLNGQRRSIPVRAIREGDALYYIGEFSVSDRETLDFELRVTPEGGEPIGIRFQQQFFAN